MLKDVKFYCVGNDLARLWGKRASEADISAGVAELFKLGKINWRVIDYVEEKFPNNMVQRMRHAFPFMVLPVDTANSYASKLGLPLITEDLSYSEEAAKHKVKELFFDVRYGELKTDPDIIH